MADQVLTWISQLGPAALYGVTALLAFAETAVLADIVLPGEAGMVVVAAAAARRAQAELPILMAAGVVGAVVGDSVSYAIGRGIGVDIVNRWAFTRRHFSGAVRKAKRRFSAHGGATVFLGRFVGALRAVVPLVAGGAGMPYPRFLAWNVAASLVWVPLVLSLGWFAGAAIAEAIDHLGWAISAAVVVALGGWFAVRQWRRRHRPLSVQGFGVRKTT